MIRRVRVTYRLALDADADRDAVDRAFRHHPANCPVYRSIHPQIDVTTALELTAT